MKKIVLLSLFGLVLTYTLMFAGFSKSKAAEVGIPELQDLSVSFNNEPANQTYVNDTVRINFTVNNLPTATKKVVFYITDIDGTEYQKNYWENMDTSQPFTPSDPAYAWDTTADLSNPGGHVFYVKAFDQNNNLLAYNQRGFAYNLTAGAIIDVQATENGTDSEGGVVVKIDVTASQLPTDSDHINLWISANSNENDLYLKTTWGLNMIQSGIGGTFNGTFIWNTGENKSEGGWHHIKAELMRADGSYITKGEEDYWLNNDGGDGDGGGGGNWDENGNNPFEVGGLGFFNPREVKGAEEIVLNVIGLLLSLGGVVAVVSLVYSGVIYLTAGDDSNKTEAAKKNITWALTGLAMAAGALIIVQIVANVLN